MNKYLKQVGSLMVILALVGCATRAAFNSIAVTEAGVLAANAAYLEKVVTGQLKTNSVPVVEGVFNDTQLSLHAAAVLSASGPAGPVPPSVAVKVQNFNNLVNSAQ